MYLLSNVLPEIWLDIVDMCILASLNIPKRCIMIKILRTKKTDSSLIKVLLNKTLCSHVSTVIYLVCFLLLEQNLVAKYWKIRFLQDKPKIHWNFLQTWDRKLGNQMKLLFFLAEEEQPFFASTVKLIHLADSLFLRFPTFSSKSDLSDLFKHF